MTLEEGIKERHKRQEKKAKVAGIIACSVFTAFFAYGIWISQDIVARVAIGVVWFVFMGVSVVIMAIRKLKRGEANMPEEGTYDRPYFHKRARRKRNIAVLTIVLLICVTTAMIFGVDSHLKNRYSDPILVAENFAMGFVLQGPGQMKKWSSKDIHGQIDEGDYMGLMIPSIEWDSDGLQMVGWSRLGDTIVVSHQYRDSRFDGDLMDTVLCTVVLQPEDRPSLWEKLRDFVNRSSSLHRRRWIVVNFLSEGRLEDYLDKLEEYIETQPFPPDIDSEWVERLWETGQKRIEFETEWSKSYMKKQHTEVYTRYKKYLVYLLAIGFGR